MFQLSDRLEQLMYSTSCEWLLFGLSYFSLYTILDHFPMSMPVRVLSLLSDDPPTRSP